MPPRWRPHSSDHPRSRGVYGCLAALAPLAPGSSPLARGLRGAVAVTVEDAGIIPARAGFTARPRCAASARRDHPRSRGVYMARRPPTARTHGSSPLARGLRRGTLTPRRLLGIIPARAGFTRRARGDHRRGRDHPRSRGVYRGGSKSSHMRSGSSPLARGLRQDQDAHRRGDRIIPARAGFTDRYALLEDEESGSSPLARGLPGRRTWAGRSPLDHPRSRGVYRARPPGRGDRQGSSPLARGLHPGDQAAGVGAWIIPARAGFT